MKVKASELKRWFKEQYRMKDEITSIDVRSSVEDITLILNNGQEYFELEIEDIKKIDEDEYEYIITSGYVFNDNKVLEIVGTISDMDIRGNKYGTKAVAADLVYQLKESFNDTDVTWEIENDLIFVERDNRIVNTFKNAPCRDISELVISKSLIQDAFVLCVQDKPDGYLYELGVVDVKESDTTVKDLNILSTTVFKNGFVSCNEVAAFGGIKDAIQHKHKELVFSSIKIDYKQLKVQMDKVRRMKEQ